MLVPLKWAREYVDIDIAVDELADKMTMSGSYVEEVKTLSQNISNVVVGKILSVEPHPDADKLVVCKVDTGSEEIQIVTGAPNIKPGQLVPVALHGAQLPGDIKIKKGKLRGVESHGMMCSGEELELKDADYPGAEVYGIMILNEEYPLGMDIKEALDLGGDVIDFEITANRPDCLCITGMAREIAVTLGNSFNMPQIQVKPSTGSITDEVGITVLDPTLCPRYAARVVKDIKIESSPQWMKRRLAAAGVRPINNIVDITNYVMLELGQPMHAFDLDKLAGKSIIVRKAKEGELITTLDDKKRQLTKDMLVISDSEQPVAIAGVMGGANSEINPQTKNILLESAIFNGGSVRTTSKVLGLRSEASSRFEKGLDINTTIIALSRAVQLIQELGAGTVVEGVIDVLGASTDKRSIQVRWNRINEILGLELSAEEIIKMLTAVSLEVILRDDIMDVNIPTYRADIEGVADLAEEVARIYGYNNIPMTLMENTASRGTKSLSHRLIDNAKQALAGMGLFEVVTYSFTSPRVYESIGIIDHKDVPPVVKIANPLGEDQSVMRTTLIPSILDVLSRNYNRRLDKCAIFEVNNIFLPKSPTLEELPIEILTLTMGSYGDDADFYSLKGQVERLTAVFGLDGEVSFTAIKNPTFHPGRTAKISVKGLDLGIIGEVHPKVCENFQIGTKTYVAELNVEVLLEQAVTEKQHTALPKYPAVTRDLAFTVQKQVLAGDIQAVITQNGGSILENAVLFDVYEGNQIPDGYKSMAYALSYRASDRTLKDAEVNTKHEKIMDSLMKGFNAKLR